MLDVRYKTYVMNDVRASVCKVRAFKASSRYAGTLSMLRSTASVGVMIGREGLKYWSSGQLGDDGRDEAGVSGSAG